MLFSMIGAAWFIVLCLADKREKKARDGETEVGFNVTSNRLAYDFFDQ